MISLAQLAASLGVDAPIDTKITGITADSAAVGPGMLFAAMPGSRTHGARFAEAAMHAGAVAVVTDEAGGSLIGGDAPVIIVPRLGEQIGHIAAMVYGQPAERLRLYGITGTNGKTTTSFMLQHLLSTAGRNTGLIGGVELRVGRESTPAVLTTPMPSDVQRLLASHVAGGGTDLVMEVTSHALVQQRVSPLRFAVAGFTNLTQDHLDYHSTLREYFEAKAALFTPERCDAAVIMIDDEWGRTLYERAVSTLDRVYAVSTSDELPSEAAGWRVVTEAPGAFTMLGSDGSMSRHEIDLPGEFNVANAALAVGMALAGGVAVGELPEKISAVVPGRMETISVAGPRVIVDFAHNTAALTLAMSALRPTTQGRLIVVTGSAGDRDAEKRVAMGRVVAEHADVVIITDDDPHREDPALIRRALLDGAQGRRATVTEIADRSLAIREAILRADDEDTVLLAGRGHETVQEVGDRLIELDDRQVAREALGMRRSSR